MPKTFNRDSMLLALAGIVAAAGIGWLIFRSVQPAPVTISNPDALMVVTFTGGMCNGPCNHPVNSLMENGDFGEYKRLETAEVTELKSVIAQTDFLKYQPSAEEYCGSHTDGVDQVLLFPQKYGNKTFTPCELAIPDDDPTFAVINKILEVHTVK